MNKDKQKSYQECLKRMRDSVNKNKEVLGYDFPDGVTFVGNPDLLEKLDDEIDGDQKK